MIGLGRGFDIGKKVGKLGVGLSEEEMNY